MHIKQRDETPSKAFCFIIEYTPYLLLQLSLGIGSDDNFTISSTDFGFRKSALDGSSKAKPTASKCATRKSILLNFTNFNSVSVSRIFLNAEFYEFINSRKSLKIHLNVILLHFSDV